MRVLVTGGAGFVGANLAISLAERHPDWELLAFDNLHRRGSELNLPRLDEAGVAFVQGDVRSADELMEVEPVDALIECSAEPSVMAGTDGETAYIVHTNLIGAYNCLELARRDEAQLVFLSTSRVYPMRLQGELGYEEARDPLRAHRRAGASRGVRPTGSPRISRSPAPARLYGATKLAAELLIAGVRATLRPAHGRSTAAA